MPRHRLVPLFEPSTLLVVSQRELPVMQVLPDALKASSTCLLLAPDQAPIVPSELNGVDAGARVDLAIVCVDASRLPDTLLALKPHRPRALIVLSVPSASADTFEDMVYCRTWAQLNDCALLGPRSFGVQRPVQGFNFSHGPHHAETGRVALVAQSSSLVAAVLDWAVDVSLGFSTVISLGHEASVDVAEVLDYLVADAETDSIALYLNDVADTRRLASAMRAAAAVKPLVILKSRHSVVNDDVPSDAVFDALLRRAGAVRIPYFVQLFSALKVLRYKNHPRGSKIALFANGSGAAQLALDVMGPGFATERATLSQASMRDLAQMLDIGSRVDNPIVSSTPLSAERTRQVVQALLDDAGVDGLLVLLTPDPFTDIEAVARQLVSLASQGRKPIVTCLIGESRMRALRHLFDEVDAPAFRTPESAASAFGVLAAYHYNQGLSRQTLPPQAFGRSPRVQAARDIVAQARQHDRLELLDDECKRLLACFHIPIADADADKRPCDRAADSRRAAADELFVAIRVRRDPRMGPYISFGAGGTYRMPAPDDAIELPPLTRFLARQLIERSAIWTQVLARELSPAAFDVLQDALERISQLVSMLPDIEAIEIDPLRAGTIHLQAHRIQVRLTREPVSLLPESSGYRHMAIHPYPRHLVQAKHFRDGREWLMRPIRPEDAQALQDFVRGLSRQTRYMRFVSMLRELTPNMLARYTRIDYDRELAIVATVQAPNPLHRGHPSEKIVGFAHYLRNADGRGAEIALVIGDEWQRMALGSQLMRGLIDAALVQGLTYLDGYVLVNNTAMLALMTQLGFQRSTASDDPEMVYVVLDLGEAAK